MTNTTYVCMYVYICTILSVVMTVLMKEMLTFESSAYPENALDSTTPTMQSSRCTLIWFMVWFTLPKTPTGMPLRLLVVVRVGTLEKDHVFSYERNDWLLNLICRTILKYFPLSSRYKRMKLHVHPFQQDPCMLHLPVNESCLEFW